MLLPSKAKALREHITKHWKKHPDAMSSKLELTGLTVGTLNRHVANGNLIGTVIGGKMLISKQSLIGHLSSPETVRRVGTEQLQKLLAGYKKEKK